MQKLIFTLVIAVAYAAVVQVSGFVCPEGDKDSANWYANPDSCTSFILCTSRTDGSKKSEVKECLKGLYWNDVKKGCVNQEDSTCAADIETITNPSTADSEDKTTDATTEGTTETETDATTDASTDASTDAPTDAPTDSPTDVPTDAPTDATTDAPTDTTDDDITDTPTEVSTTPEESTTTEEPETTTPNSGQKHSIKKCSDGLLFDKEKLTCNYAGVVNPNGPPK